MAEWNNIDTGMRDLIRVGYTPNATEASMKLNQMRHVAAVAERGSLRSAARHLGIAQPTISRSIQDLERELGAKLFERTPTGIILTAAGELFQRRAHAMEADLQRTIDAIAQLQGDHVGLVTVGLSSGAHVALLPRVLGQFRRRFPNIRINIVEGLFPQLEHDIRDGLLDLYVGPVVADVKDGSLLVKTLFRNRRIIVARRNHPLGHARSVKDLAHASWVTTPVMAATEREVSVIYSQAGLPLPNIVAHAKSGLSIITIVASTDLLAPMPEAWSQIIDRLGIVQEIPIQEITYSPTICSVRRTRLPLTPAAEYFNDLIEQAAAEYAAMIDRAAPNALGE